MTGEVCRGGSVGQEAVPPDFEAAARPWLATTNLDVFFSRIYKCALPTLPNHLHWKLANLRSRA